VRQPRAQARQRRQAVVRAFAWIVVVQHQHGVVGPIAVGEEKARIDTGRYLLVDLAGKLRLELGLHTSREDDPAERKRVYLSDAILWSGAGFVMEQQMDLLSARWMQTRDIVNDRPRRRDDEISGRQKGGRDPRRPHQPAAQIEPVDAHGSAECAAELGPLIAAAEMIPIWPQRIDDGDIVSGVVQPVRAVEHDTNPAGQVHERHDDGDRHVATA